MPSSVRRIGAITAGLLLAAGCAQDRPTAPVPATGLVPAISQDLLGGVTGALQLTTENGVLRTTPLAADITVSKAIGVQGGSLSIPQAGVTVTIPYGALASTTQITMTARKGSLIAYDFAPHGITFAKAIGFRQSLSGTNARLLDGPNLRLSYYTDPGMLGTVTATVTELVAGVLNLLDWSFTAPIAHFSGYVLTCGRADATE